jgi:tRNA pseudouridine55 synthase
VGQATRLIEYVQQMPKQYRATFLLGKHSETDDVEGEVHNVSNAPQPSLVEIEQIVPQFLGHVQQTPPAHSAVKVRGRRAYHLARAGKPGELAARTVTIHRLVIRRYEYPELELDIECGSGTYVRSLGRDMAATLGTSAVMSALERASIGPYVADEAVRLDQLNSEALLHYLLPALSALHEMPRVTVSDAQLGEVRHGRPLPTREVTDFSRVPTGSEFAAVNAAGELVAILHEKKPAEAWPLRNFL